MSWTELVGNVLCLDFANSVNRRPDPERDWLAEPDGLRRWAVHAGVDAARRRTGPDDAALLADARALRDAVHRTFSAVASGKDPAAADLAVIAEQYAAGVVAARLAGGSASYTMVWPRQASHRQVLCAAARPAGPGGGVPVVHLAVPRHQPQRPPPLVQHGHLRQPVQVRPPLRPDLPGLRSAVVPASRPFGTAPETRLCGTSPGPITERRSLLDRTRRMV